MKWTHRSVCSFRVNLLASCGLAFLAITIQAGFCPTARGQGAPRFENWPAFEKSAELATYKKELEAGSAFTDRNRQLLLNDGLPQLLEEANRDRLAAIRAQIPGLLLENITSADAFRDAATAAAEALDELARRQDASIEGSVNACLLLGELRAKDGRLLAAATPLLGKLTLDTTVTPAVRIAALVGLRGRVEAAGGGSSAETKAAAVDLLPTLEKLLQLDQAEPQATSTVVHSWLQQRSLDLALNIIPLTADDSKPVDGLRTAAIGLLQDADKAINLRVRAAVLLSRTFKSDKAALAAEISELINAVAVAAVADDRQALQLIKLEQSLSGIDLQGGGMAMMAGPMMDSSMMDSSLLGPDGTPLQKKPSLLSQSRCLQTSWRLASLGDALASIATTLGEQGKPFQDQAAKLQGLGIEIYKSPSDETVLAAADAIDPLPEPTKVEGEDEKPNKPAGSMPQPGTAPNTPFSPFQLR
jgi:hypothetical protein